MIVDDFAASKSYLRDLRQIPYNEMARDAGFLSADFGFRSAVASNDVPTIESSVYNIQSRVERDNVSFIRADGTAIGLDHSLDQADRAKLLDAITHGATRGIVALDDVNNYAVAVPSSPPTRLDGSRFLPASAMPITGGLLASLLSQCESPWSRLAG